MDYNEVFGNDLERKFFYTDYPGKKMVVGTISLQNAIVRLDKDEYYILVTYKEGEKIPEQYVPLSQLKSDDGTLFATINPATRFSYICNDGGIQRISRLSDLDSGSPNYLLGPGPDTVALADLVAQEHNYYNESKAQTTSVRHGR